MKKYLLMLICLLLFLSGCNNISQYSEAEIDQIVDKALNKGESANLLYLGEFNTYPKFAFQTDNGLEYSTIQKADTLPLLCGDDIWALLQTFTSADDIKGYMRGVFLPNFAEQYLADMFTADGDKYIFQDGNFLQCEQLAVYPLSLIQWQHRPSSIIVNQKNKLTVILKGRFILTGTETELPLNLTKQDEQWLLDESFSPREQQPEDYYYTQAELQDILENTLAKAEIANKLYVADSLPAIPKSVFTSDNTEYILVDKNPPYNNDYTDLAKKFTTTEAIKQSYRDTFIAELAKSYIDALFYRDAPLYIDTPQGLAYLNNVACMPITLLQWQTDDYYIWQNSREEIIVIMGAIEHYPAYTYYPLRLHLVDGKWLCDETYNNYANNYWDIAG